MNRTDTLYALMLTLSALVALLVAVVAWRRRSAPGALGLILFEASAFVWSSSYALQWMLTDHGPSHFWLVVRLIGVFTAPMAALIMVLGYTGRRRWITGGNLALLLCVPLALLLLAATDPLHHLYLGDGAAQMRVTSGGPLVVVTTAYGLSLLLASMIILARGAARQHRVYRLQSLMLIVAIAVPLVTTILEASGAHAFSVINATPIVFTLTGPLLAFALFRLGLLGLVPVARDRVVEGLRDGIIVVDPEERIIDLNPAAVRLTTVAKSDVGRDLDAAFPASEGVIAQLRDSLEVDGATLEVSPRGHPERVVEISASPIHESSGRRIAVVATVRDVTERVRMAQELKTRTDELALALERSSTVLAAMSEGVVLVDGDGTLVSCNPAVWRILRTERVLSPGSPAADLGDVLPVEALMARAREAGEPITRLVEVGGGRSIGVEVIPLQPRDARPPQTLFVIRDETERDAARRMQRNFMANVSHELLTPLTGLSLLADTVPRALRDDPGRVDGFARRLSTEVRRVTRIAETLLTLSRVEEVGSAADPPQTRIDISRLISEIVDGITPLLHEKGHHLVVDAPRGLWVKGDGPSLSALVGGLLENAVHYTPPEGHISVRTGLDDEGGCPWVVLRVTDDGVGISADDQQRIFERFYRVDKARSRTTGGTGLGLSIVQQTAEQHGGSVSVESRLGSGSTFTVRLPADV